MVTESLQVTVLFKRRRMRYHGLSLRCPMILWIFLLHQATESFSASIQLSGSYRSSKNGTRHTELSDIIEYVPSDFPADAANISLSNEMEEHTSNRRISTFRLKTFLHVENGQNTSEPNNSERQQKYLVARPNEGAPARSGDTPRGLSLDKIGAWNKRLFVHGNVERNTTKYSLEDLEYVPGEVKHHVSENLERIMDGTVEDPTGNKPLLDETEHKPYGLSLEDGGWKKKPYLRGKVERNETKSSLSDIEYEPGDILSHHPGVLYNMWFEPNEELEESKEPEEDYTLLTPESKHTSTWDTKLLDDSQSGAGKAGRGNYDYISEKMSPDSPADSEQYWYGPGKIEKLYYSNGKKTWREISGNQKVITDKRPPRNEERSSYRRGRELPYDSSDDDISAGSSSSSSDEVTESIEFTYNSQENHKHKVISKDIRHSRVAKAKQFVFHPYLPYGKDVPADEKIKFSDILPIKMVKFVKSMVEEAPWEQMFIKMVRMVVDQFVDKIIEKMFADKHDEHLRKRSIDSFLGDFWDLPTFVSTPVVRRKRSLHAKTPEQDEDFFSTVPINRDSQSTDDRGKKTEEERKTWLDHFLDYVFPDSKSDDPGDLHKERLTKRDANNAHLFRFLVSYFVNYFEKTSELLTDAKDTLRYKMLKDILPYLYQKRFLKPDTPTFGSSNSVESIQMSPRDVVNDGTKKVTAVDTSQRSLRKKRSLEEARREENGRRLWQESSRRHKPHHRRMRDDCSLRRACNAGRFLSRLPAVEEITMQLQSQGNEPHWEAMIWGMKKKRCSRIFCKRQRSPKGSRHSWSPERNRPSRKLEIVTEAPNDMDETANLAR